MGRVVAMVMLGVCAGCAKPPQPPLTQVFPVIGLPPITIDQTRPGLDVQKMPSAETAAATERTIRIPAGVAGSMLERRPVTIGYPAEARARRLTGKVSFRVIVGRDGSIRGLTMVEASDSVFVPIATAYVQGGQYKPYLLNGQPIAMDTMVQVDFAPPTR